MKRSTCVLLLLGAVFAALVLPSTAQAVETSFFRGKTADVEFYSTDPTGCMVTSVTVVANENRFFNPPAPQESIAGGDITIHLFNTCTSEEMACGAGSFELPAGSFNVAALLTSATVTATGVVRDSCTFTDRPVTLALTWTGNGELAWGRTFSSMHFSGQQVWYRQTGQLRDATVVGSMTLDGVPLSLGTGTGDLSKATNGTITRFH